MNPKGPLIKYFGSKWNLSKHYPSPTHDLIIEPFAGSACYATRYADRQVVLIEKYARIARLWEWLITAPSQEIAAIPTNLPAGFDLLQLGLRPEALDLVIRWQRTGAVGSWPTHASSWGSLPGQWTSNTRDRLARDVEAIKHWKIVTGDYTLAKDCSATWFVDPPYQHVTDAYGQGRPDYDVLADWCQARQGQVIVCEQKGSSWLPFITLRDGPSMARGKRGGKKDCAVFWHKL